ncbi:patatin-like phospholipase family protein [Kitasatospora mediocidica]|uniref:patatin-like phospholipase family protein n=1 Tax=Kitasatospora mediocidica TaxID=58352 RepID=UPI0006905CCB|nr:patatin-like phospholipase family protein [Kitasatospora mediocidica]
MSDDASGTAGQELKVDLVLEGGGVKGIGLLGAVLTLSEAGYSFPRVAGTSAGAIVASLVAAYQKAGRDLHELREVMDTVDYSQFARSPTLERMTGRLGQSVELLLHEGAHSGDYLAGWLGPVLAQVGVVTFGDLAIAPEADPGSSLAPYQRYSLVVHTSDVSRHALVRLPWDYPQYSRKPDEQRVADAVRASMSIPFYFQPVHMETGAGKVTWVDGGLLSNFPITVFDRTDGLDPRWPTWGVKLSALPQPKPDVPVKSALGIAVNSLETLTGDWNRYHLQEEGVSQRTIYVDTAGMSATDFHLGPQDRSRLFSSGQEAARQFLARVHHTP